MVAPRGVTESCHFKNAHTQKIGQIRHWRRLLKDAQIIVDVASLTRKRKRTEKNEGEDDYEIEGCEDDDSESFGQFLWKNVSPLKKEG